MAPTETDDYRFITIFSNEDIPGLADYINCAQEFSDIVDAALKLKKKLANQKKPAKLSWDPSEIISTGLVGTPHANFDYTMRNKPPAVIRDCFLAAVAELEKFDSERETLVGKMRTRLSDGVTWGFWRKGHGSGSGLKGVEEFKVQFSSKDSKGVESPIPRWGTRQGYRDQTPVVKLDLQSFEQSGVTYYVGAASFAEIDSVSKVPSFPSSVTDVEWGNRVLQPSDSDDQFQRPLDLSRMQEIQSFVRPVNNRILNSVIVYIPPECIKSEDSNNPSSSVNLEQITKSGRHRMTIDVSSFLQIHDDGVGRTWDESTGLDLRPLMLIDGQHRTRGGAISPEGKDKKVPIVVLPPEMTLADVARVFTEINTGSEELGQLHQLHLRHRFYLASTQRARDFRNWKEMSNDDSSRTHCRANRMGYELAAKHACTEGPLYSRIRMMDVGSGGSSIATNAKVFTDYSSTWFRPGFPFGRESTTLDDAFAVTNAYFSAWQMVVDRDKATGLEPWEDDTNRWFPIPQKGSGKPLNPYITMPLPFGAVLSLFPLAYELSSKKAPGNQPGLDEFIEVLKPIHALDFSEIKLLKESYGLDKYTANDLYTWFSWAIQDFDARGKIYPREEVWNPDDRRHQLCKPGRGFFSPANKDLVQIHISIPPGKEWPEPGENIRLWSPRLPNCCTQVEWQMVVDDQDSPAIKSTCHSDGANLDILVNHEMASAKKIRFTVFWRRSPLDGRLSPPASGSLVLERDDSGSLGFTEGAGFPPKHPPSEPESGSESEELEHLEGDEFVLVTDFGEGPMLAPPSSNSMRGASPPSWAPAFFRRPWCQKCFFGEDHKETRNCFSYRDVYGGN